MAKKFKKYLPKAGATAAIAMAMTVALATQVSATEIDENDFPTTGNPPVEEDSGSNVALSNVIEPAEANAAIEEENKETAAENTETGETNQQVAQSNNDIADINENDTDGALPNPDLELPETPVLPNTDGMSAEEYNEAVGGYNEAVGGYNEAVDGYNEGADEYNAAADEYDQQAQQQYEEEMAAYEEAKAEHEEAEKQHEEELKQYEEDSQAYQDYLKEQAQYEEDQKQYEEDLKQYEQDQAQHQEDTQAYEDYLKAQADYEQAQKDYEEALAQYELDKAEHDQNAQAYDDYLKALADYEQAQKDYEDALAQYELDKAAHDQKVNDYEDYLDELEDYEDAQKDFEDAYDQYEQDLEDYEQALEDYNDYLDEVDEYEKNKADHEKVVDAYEEEDAIYDEVSDYNQQVEEKNEDIETKNAALEDDLHSNIVADIDEIGEFNDDVQVSADILNILDGYDALIGRQSELQAAAAALDGHAGKGAALGSAEYAEYLAAVKTFNDQIAAYNQDVDAYNAAVATYNAAVDAYNATVEPSSDSTIGSGTATGTADWGNIKDDIISHIDVKYNAAASKNVTVENGETTYSDTVTQYTVTGVYTSEASAKNNPNSFGVTYLSSNGQTKTQAMYKYEAYDEFHSHNVDGISLDRDTGKISFYVTLVDGNKNTHGITVNLDGSSTYAQGSYYKAESNDFLHLYKDSQGNGLPTVKIGNETYYDISGKSIFVISALTCDGMSSTQAWWETKARLTPWGLDLVLNLQTMIEIHQADNAKKVGYLGYEKGKTAQATAPTNPGEFTENEPAPMDPPKPPTEPTFDLNAPDLVPEPGNAPTAPTAPTAPDLVPEPGNAPTAPTAPTAPDLVPTPGDAPTAPTAPIAPNVVTDPGEVPVGPGAFDLIAPQEPISGSRMEYVQKLDTLAEKLIITITEPDEPGEPIDPPLVPTSGDFEIPDEPVPLGELPDVLEILDEDVPLADAPETGDSSILFGAMSAFSAFGMAALQLFGRKKKEEV